jgi:hypothetical protein
MKGQVIVKRFGRENIRVGNGAITKYVTTIGKYKTGKYVISVYIHL